jgi:hypothetical protein
LAFGCVKLKTLDCASSPEGCQDRQPDARRVDPEPNPDTHVQEPADTRSADLAENRVDAAIDSPQDSASPPDSAAMTSDGALPDTTRDTSGIVQDAPLEAPAKDVGVPDGRPDTMDAPDAARSPDTRTPDTAPLPDVSAVYTVTFNAGVAKGAMSGYGWVTMGALDIVTSPTCGSSNAPITSANTCLATQTNWESSNALCVSGTIPALPANPTSTDYSDNWGMQLGANASDPIGALGKTYSTITLNFTGSPQAGLRATVHRTGDPVGTTYCSLVTSGTPMALTSFNTSCWNNSGTSLTTADLPKIDKVGLEVVSTQAEITVSKLCLTSIVFGS